MVVNVSSMFYPFPDFYMEMTSEQVYNRSTIMMYQLWTSCDLVVEMEHVLALRQVYNRSKLYVALRQVYNRSKLYKMYDKSTTGPKHLQHLQSIHTHSFQRHTGGWPDRAHLGSKIWIDPGYLGVLI